MMTRDATRTRLFSAIRNRESLDDIQSIVKQSQFPITTLVEQTTGDNVLHFAFINTKELNAVVQYFIKEFPDLLKMTDYSGRLPLHYAFAYCSDPDILILMLDAYPEAAGITDNDLDTPLHFAIFSHRYYTARPEILRLISLFPQAISSQNRFGNTPLHSAGLHLALVMIQHAPPGATRIRNQRGESVLHAACRRNAHTSLEWLEPICESYRVACLVCDNGGKLPFDHEDDLFNWTKGIFVAFLDIVLMSDFVLVSAAVTTQVVELLAKEIDDDSLLQASHGGNNKSVKEVFLQCTKNKQKTLMHKILNNVHVQALVTDVSYENLLVGLAEMNKAGRCHYLAAADSSFDVVRMLTSLKNREENLDCIYWIVREKPEF